MGGLSNRELATVLAALRYWQSRKETPESLDGYFYEHSPLTVEEIDGLCERLNTTTPAEAADCPSCQPCRNAALIRCRDCGKTFTPCDEYLIPGEPPERNVACCLAKGHAGPHQDAPLPRRRWTS